MNAHLSSPGIRRLLFLTLAFAAVLGAVSWAAGAASAHGGIDAGQEPWTAWNTNPLPTILVLIAAYVYMNGLNNWDRPTHPINNWQKASFFFGLFPRLFRTAVAAGPAVRPPPFFPPGSALHPANGCADVHTPGRTDDSHASRYAGLGKAGNLATLGEKPLRSTNLQAVGPTPSSPSFSSWEASTFGSFPVRSISPSATMKCTP